MHSRCDPPKFDQQDWNQFDFSRWHLDGVTLDAASAAFAGLSEQLFNSEEWRQHFQAALPALEREALSFFKGHSKQLRDQKNAAAEDFDQRIVAAQRRSDDFRKSVEIAAAPPLVKAGSNTFHLAVKVTIEDTRLDLPGLTVRIMDPRNKKIALVQAVTDRDGNAILTVPAQIAKTGGVGERPLGIPTVADRCAQVLGIRTVPEEIAKKVDKGDTVLEVLSPAGKTLVTVPGAVCVRLNQVETKVVTLPDSPEIGPHKNAALGIRSEREARVASLAARIENLKRERETRLHDLDCRLKDNEAIIAELEPKGDTGESSEAAPSHEAGGSSEAAPSQDALLRAMRGIW